MSRDNPDNICHHMRTGLNNLDLYITGAAAGRGASLTPGEELSLTNVTGTLGIRVDPLRVSDPLGTTYTLKATITPVKDDPRDDPSSTPLPSTCPSTSTTPSPAASTSARATGPTGSPYPSP